MKIDRFPSAACALVLVSLALPCCKNSDKTESKAKESKKDNKSSSSGDKK